MKSPHSFDSKQRRSLIPLLIIGVSLALLMGLYAQPFQLWQYIGADNTGVSGLYPAERNERYSYAYTDGNAEVKIPYIGTGRFVVSSRMAGPNTSIPLSGRIISGNSVIDLGQIEHERIYHVLMPSTADGDLQFALHSTTARASNDGRQLGVLLSFIQLQSMLYTFPPLSALLLIPAVLLIFWLGIAQIPTYALLKYAMLLIVGVVLSIGLAYCRAKYIPSFQPVLGASMIFTTAVSLRHLPRFFVWLSTVGRSSSRHFMATLRQVAPLFIAWRLALWGVAAIGLWHGQSIRQLTLLRDVWYRGEPFDGRAIWTAGDQASRWSFVRRVLLDAWLNWDGHRYLWIAIRGAYEFHDVYQPNIAFFPLYPVLMRLLMTLTRGDAILAGMLVSHIALLSALLLLYDVVASDLGSTVGRRAVAFLLLFPTAIFFGAIYTESLALVFAVAAVWALRRQYWWLAGVAGFFLSTSRLPGIFITPVIALTYLHHHQWQWRRMFDRSFFSSLLPPLGLAVFMLYQWHAFGTPFAFWVAQQDWDNRTSPPWVMPMTILRSLENGSNIPLDILQISTWIAFIVLTILAFRRLPLPYGLTMLFLLIPAYLSSWHLSFSRYVLPAFPAYVVLALLAEHPWIRRTYITLALPFLIGAIVLFVNGFWMG